MDKRGRTGKTRLLLADTNLYISFFFCNFLLFLSGMCCLLNKGLKKKKKKKKRTRILVAV